MPERTLLFYARLGLGEAARIVDEDVGVKKRRSESFPRYIAC